MARLLATLFMVLAVVVATSARPVEKSMEGQQNVQAASEQDKNEEDLARDILAMLQDNAPTTPPLASEQFFRGILRRLRSRPFLRGRFVSES